MNGKGKIARLPPAVREELDRRMANGERARGLLAWLNELPEVQEVVTSECGGRPIREKNLSEWRKRGHQEWVRRQEILAVAQSLAQQGEELKGQTGAELSDRVGVYLVARYAMAARELVGGAGEPEWKRLREVCHDVVALRRSDHSAQRLKFAEERLKQTQGLTDDEIIEHFEKWTKYGKVKEWILNEDVRWEDRQRKLRRIMGMEWDGEDRPEDEPPGAEEAEEEEDWEEEEWEEGGTGI